MKKRSEEFGSRSGLSRRNFLKKSSMVPLAGLVGSSGPRVTEARVSRLPQDAQVGCGLIGFGQWGREIASTLDRIPEARLAAICDNYDVMLRRAQRSFPDASRHVDYREVLASPDVQAVLVATPTHLHRDIVIEALEAGKSVYCEVPLASTLEDARAIAEAARAAEGQVFQAGLLYRSNPQARNVYQFIRSGAICQAVMVRTQWNSKESWRRASPNREREEQLNWRLNSSLSTGLVGEASIHQLDTAFWILGSLPIAATGFGKTVFWNDGRDVPDTVQAVIEFPRDVSMLYAATLASSFDGEYDMYYGSDSTILMRPTDSKAWMFKEVDAPLLGWEVYARKDTFYKEKGVALVANATKLESQGLDPAEDDPNVESPLFYALKELMDNFFYGPFPANAGYEEGYRATAVAIKINEAINSAGRMEFEPGDFELG
jgi:predicted dehydrogenase